MDILAHDIYISQGVARDHSDNVFALGAESFGVYSFESRYMEWRFNTHILCASTRQESGSQAAEPSTASSAIWKWWLP